MKYYLKTFGCKLNQSESEKINEKLISRNNMPVNMDQADFLIVNACSVTEIAEKKSKDIILRFKNKNPKGKVIVSGCLDKKNVNKIVLENIDYWIADKEKISKCFNTVSSGNNYKAIGNRTRAQIKIQTGCDNFCSYCIVPYFRGKPRSVSVKKIILEIKQKERQGYKEVVLVGVNICKYKHNNKNITSLVKEILKQTNIPRIRLSSLDPNLINQSFINLWKNKRLMPNWHMSLQSGSDKILKLMNRKYTTSRYLKLIRQARKININFSFTTDVIVGFSGETDEDFKKTIDFVKKVGFLKIHVFPYSKRPKTPAEKFKNQVLDKEKIIRSKKLRQVSLILSKEFINKNFKQNVQVLFESQKNGYWHGYTQNFIRIKYKNSKNLNNQIQNIRLTKKYIDFKYYSTL